MYKKVVLDLLMMKISACMIVKNEEEFLEECLKSIQDLADEIIIGIDQGSTDNTEIIAKKYTDKTFRFVWPNDFSKARNEVLARATGDWILSIDADEIISRQDCQRIREMLERDEADAYSTIWRDYTNESGIRGWISSKDDLYDESKKASGFTESRVLRIFRNKPHFRFIKKIHETVDQSIKADGGTIKQSGIVIHHYGNLKSKQFISEKKKTYSKMLIESLDNEKHSDEEYFTLYQLAKELLIDKETEKAQKYLEKSIELKNDYSPSLSLLGGVYLYHGDLERAEVMLKQSLAIDGEDDNAHANLGIVYSKSNNHQKALKKFERAIEINDKSADHFYNLGITYRLMGKESKAKQFFDKAIDLNPNYKKKIYD
jgi:glycosyltransferase involved in cell wall biosynthesis